MRIPGLVCVACLATGASAMSFSDLQQAVANARDGNTVVVENDIEYNGSLAFPSGAITLRSPDGATNALRRAASYTGTLIAVDKADTKLTIADLELDGNRANGAYDTYPVDVNKGTLTLDAGSILHDFRCDRADVGAGAVYVHGGGLLTMKDGAVIRDCSARSWGVAMLLTTTNATAQVFTMEGGLVTGCEDTSSTGAGDSGGAVYLYQGTMTMLGGTVTGNRSTRCTGGVVAYKGSLQIGRTAAITNNAGGYAKDINVCKTQYATGSLVFATAYTPFAAHATVHVAEKPTFGAKIYPKLNAWCHRYKPAQGLGGIACEQWPEFVMDAGVLVDDYYPVWTSRAQISARGIVGTFDEVTAQAQDGDVIELLGDVTSAQGVTVKDNVGVTVRGGGHRILRNKAESVFWLYAYQGGRLRLEDVVVDCNGDASAMTHPLVYVYSGSRLELGPGTVLENLRTAVSPGLAQIYGSGSVMTMEEGAVIRNMVDTHSAAWGFICIGNNTTLSVPPRFEMSGGYITNNVLFSQSAPNPIGYGGLVYCFKGDFLMSGGEISGNACTNATCAVSAYTGTATFSGTARVRNNIGTYPDVQLASGGTGTIVGDFRGHLGLSTSGSTLFSGENLTGACRLFKADGGDYGSQAGYCWATDKKIYFYAASDWIDGIGCPPKGEMYYLTEDVSVLAPTEINLGRELLTLPHTFKGARARAVSGALPVSLGSFVFDPATFQPVVLLHAEDGPFTGTWSFSLPPTGNRRYEWVIRRQNDGADYVLDCVKLNGLSVVVR